MWMGCDLPPFPGGVLIADCWLLIADAFAHGMTLKKRFFLLSMLSVFLCVLRGNC